jgi:hypothetical protein
MDVIEMLRPTVSILGSIFLGTPRLHLRVTLVGSLGSIDSPSPVAYGNTYYLVMGQ